MSQQFRGGFHLGGAGAGRGNNPEVFVFGSGRAAGDEGAGPVANPSSFLPSPAGGAAGRRENACSLPQPFLPGFAPPQAQQSGPPQPSAMTLPNEFYCPIGGDLMEDPVIASDGRSYSRDLIEQWFEQCRRQGLESPTSPITREPMDSRLLDNVALRLGIEQLRGAFAEAPSPAPAPTEAEAETARQARLQKINGVAPSADVGTLHELGEIFAHLDGLRDLVEQCLDGWQPPQLVVVGNENSGKSTLLERLCMMPIFPHAEELCTRMRIQVRLRRGKLSAPSLQVWNNRTKQVEGDTVVVPMETANIDVRDAMDRLLRNTNSTVRGVTTEHTLILRVQSPTVPNLDLVDLPGVVLNAAAGEPDDMPQQTKQLVNDHIDRHKDHSVFLGVVDATSAPNSSVGLQLLREKGALDRTIGVITMCDYAGAPQQKTKLRNRLEQKGDAIPLNPHGYVATMNAPVEEDGDRRSNFEKLQAQAQNEPAWFKHAGFQDVVDAGYATSSALLSRINKLFLDYMKDSWVPVTLEKLDEEHRKLTLRNLDLGLPAAGGLASPGELLELRHGAESALRSVLGKQTDWMLQQLSKSLQEKLVQPLKDSTLPFSSAHCGVRPWYGMREIPMESCEAVLQELRAEIHEICTRANNCDSTMSDSTILGWLRTALQRDESEFKLSRFPALEIELIKEAYGHWQKCWKSFSDGVPRVLNSLLTATGSAVRLTVNSSKLTTCVDIDTDRVIGTIVQLYGGPRIKFLKNELSRCAAVSVNVIARDTVEDCVAERAQILQKIQRVDEARDGIEAIACSVTPMIVVTGSNIAATFQGVYRAVASPTGGEFAYVNLHGRRLFKSIDDCWCLKNMTVNDDGVRSVNGRGSAPNRRRFYCGRHLGTDGTIVGDNVKGGSLYGRCGPDGGSEQCHSCQRYQSDHSAWFRSAAMPTGTRTWNYNSKTGPFQIPEIVVDPSRPLEVSLTLARTAEDAAAIAVVLQST